MSVSKNIVEKVMGSVEEFYMSDGDEGGEAIFKKFAKEHVHVFEGDYEYAEDNDNKLEYTLVHKKY